MPGNDKLKPFFYLCTKRTGRLLKYFRVSAFLWTTFILTNIIMLNRQNYYFCAAPIPKRWSSSPWTRLFLMKPHTDLNLILNWTSSSTNSPTASYFYKSVTIPFILMEECHEKGVFEVAGTKPPREIFRVPWRLTLFLLRIFKQGCWFGKCSNDI